MGRIAYAAAAMAMGEVLVPLRAGTGVRKRVISCSVDRFASATKRVQRTAGSAARAGVHDGVTLPQTLHTNANQLAT